MAIIYSASFLYLFEKRSNREFRRRRNAMLNRRLSYILPFVLLLIIPASLNAQVDPGTANLTNSWTFNDGTANDYVGGANGTLMGNAQIFEGSLLTADSGSWMEMPGDKISINTFDEITLEIWFIPVQEGNTGWHMIAYFGDTNPANTLGVNYYFITPARQDNVSRTAISCGDLSTPYNVESGANGTELDDGELHHMVSTLGSTDITLYIDGQLQATTPLAANNYIAALSNVHAYLAKSGYDGDLLWAGEILEFNIYNKVLTADEVLFLYNKGASITGVDKEIKAIPKDYRLLQNYPNPFNPSTLISFDLPKNSFVSLNVYNSLGEEIAELGGREYSAGLHTVRFDATNLSSGVYFYTIRAGNYTSTQKMIFQK
jgi:hypothetical protein